MVFIVLFFAIKRTRHSDRLIAAILAFFWLWIGLRFWLPFSVSTPTFYAIAALFIIQGSLFLVEAVKPSMAYRIGTDVYSLTGVVLILYAMVGFPIGAYLVGHIYPQMGMVGMFPCPTVLFTCGLLLCANSKVQKYMLIIPLLWGFAGVYWTTVGLVEGAGVVVGAVVATAMIVYRDRKALAEHAYRTA
ncbi:hypothetical protein ANRL1_01983 [Anaerolineae bacterium]|nr:hypothetical protein ANRL1_01983 [Anaerolineae bacterium]